MPSLYSDTFGAGNCIVYVIAFSDMNSANVRKYASFQFLEALALAFPEV